MVQALAEAFTESQVIVAFISFVLGPVLVVLATNATSAKRAQLKAKEAVQDTRGVEPGEGRGDVALVETILEWRDSMREETAELQREIRDLRDKIVALKIRVSSLERENALVKQLNAHNAAQVIALGGQPFTLESSFSNGKGSDQ